MRLSSARALKEELLSQAFAQPNGVKIAARYLREMGDARANPIRRPSVALGIAPVKAEYCLAVRLMDQSMPSRLMALHAINAAKNEADVQFVGRIRGPRDVPQTVYEERARPIAPGYSIGHYRVTAGTIGAFVTRRSDNHIYLLSNNHVLADSNRGARGDDVLQPGPDDGGRRRRDYVGWLQHWVPLTSDYNTVDAALAAVWNKVDLRGDYAGVTIAGVRDSVDSGDPVWKIGRSTGFRRGRISAFDVDEVEVDYSDEGDGSDICIFHGQIEIKGPRNNPFSLGGDSGSLILDHENNAVGLLFAGSDEAGVTYANPIGVVIEALDIEDLAAVVGP